MIRVNLWLVTAVLTLGPVTAFATEPVPSQSSDAADVLLREQAVVWGTMLRDASNMAGCDPAQKAWLASVQDSLTAEMATEAAQLRQLAATKRNALDGYAVKIRTWVLAQKLGQTGCRS
jgi:hypothetical protein